MCMCMCMGILSAAPGDSEPWGQGGILGLENDVDLMGRGCKWSDVGFLNKQQSEEKLLT